MAPVALVTGASRGIGQEIAATLRDAGFSVAVTYRTGDAPAGFFSVKCDVTSTSEVDAAFDQIEKELGPVEVLVANAGVTADGLVLRMGDEDFEKVLEANLFGAFRCARRASKGMLKQRKGRIIFIGSVVGMFGSAGQTNYAATKSGLIGLARSLARELGSRNITANVVAPGFIETDMTKDLSQDRKDEIASAIPLGRYGTTNEVAEVVKFLATEAGSYITGAVIPVDGGLGMGH